MVEEDEGEEEHSRHHGESAGIVWISTLYEALVLQVSKGTHRNLKVAIKKGVFESWLVLQVRVSVTYSYHNGINLFYFFKSMYYYHYLCAMDEKTICMSLQKKPFPVSKF